MSITAVITLFLLGAGLGIIVLEIIKNENLNERFKRRYGRNIND